MWSCASQLWVPGESCGHGRPYLSFCPITLRHCSFRSWWVCRWMQNSKRNRRCPFYLGGGSGRGVWGGVVSTPKSIRAFQNFNASWADTKKFSTPPSIVFTKPFPLHSTRHTILCLRDNTIICLRDNSILCLRDNTILCLRDNSILSSGQHNTVSSGQHKTVSLGQHNTVSSGQHNSTNTACPVHRLNNATTKR